MTLEEYIKKRAEIIAKMFRVLMRAQRKLDDNKYKQILEKLNK